MAPTVLLEAEPMELYEAGIKMFDFRLAAFWCTDFGGVTW